MPACNVFEAPLAGEDKPVGGRMLHLLEDRLARANLHNALDVYWPQLQDIMQKAPESEKALGPDKDLKGYSALCKEFASVQPKRKASAPSSPDDTAEDPLAMPKTTKGPVSVLQRLFSALSREMPAFRFDCLAHHRRCWSLLRALQ